MESLETIFWRASGVNLGLDIGLVLLFFYIMRDKFDKRYVQEDRYLEDKSRVPKDKCYKEFVTIKEQEKNEKREEEKHSRIDESLVEIKNILYKFIYRKDN